MFLNSFNIKALLRPNILDLAPYTSARDEFQGQANIFLDANENPFESLYNRYPDPLQRELKEAISQLKGCNPEAIFLGNGSDEPIDLLLRLFCEPGRDHILITPPTYGMYRVAADIAGIGVREVPLTAKYELQPGEILAQADAHSKILFLCSPNNPTGNLQDREIVLHLAKHFPGLVVLDEAYIDFAMAGSCLPYLDAYPNLVILQTFSKAWGLAAVRLGMAFASPAIIGWLNKVKAPYNINVLTSRFVSRQLPKVHAKDRAVSILIRERERLAGVLSDFPFVQKVHPSDANFLLVIVTDPERLYHHLLARGIVVRNRSSQPLCGGGLRITVGTPAQNQLLLAALRDWAFKTEKP